jgi:biopolymer transport protein ExbD
MNEMMVVSLDNLGQVYVEKQVVSQQQLAQLLKNYYLLNPNGLVVLHASKEARYSNVIELLDVLRTFGGDRVGLATLPGDSPQETTP